jgi:hypothetical protein
MTLVKSTPKKVTSKKPLLGPYVVHYRNQYEKIDYLIPYSIYSKKRFHLLEGTMNLFGNFKRSKMEETVQYFEKRFFYKQILDFHCLSKILCHTSKR